MNGCSGLSARPRCARTRSCRIIARICVVGEQRQLVELVRGAEPVEEMQERDARLERRGLRDQRRVVRLLHRAGGQQRKAGRARRHHVGMVAEDRQRLRRERARRDVEDRRGQLAGDLEHVGQHQHQALRGREGRRQRARLQRAVHGAGGAAFALHLLHDRDVAPDVGRALRRPLVGELGHGRGRGDRVDRAHLVDAVGDVRDRGVAVHRVALSGCIAVPLVSGRFGDHLDGVAGALSKQTAQPVQRS